MHLDLGCTEPRDGSDPPLERSSSLCPGNQPPPRRATRRRSARARAGYPHRETHRHPGDAGGGQRAEDDEREHTLTHAGSILLIGVETYNHTTTSLSSDARDPPRGARDGAPSALPRLLLRARAAPCFRAAAVLAPTFGVLQRRSAALSLCEAPDTHRRCWLYGAESHRSTLKPIPWALSPPRSGVDLSCASSALLVSPCPRFPLLVPRFAAGVCQRHYTRLTRHGPMTPHSPGRRPPPASRCVYAPDLLWQPSFARPAPPRARARAPPWPGRRLKTGGGAIEVMHKLLSPTDRPC